MNTKLINSIPITVPKEPLLKLIGLNTHKNVSKRVEITIDKAIHKVQCYAEAKAIYKEILIRNKNGSVTMDGGVTFDSKILTKVLSACDKAAVFLVTIGNKIDKMVQQILKHRSYSGFILDAAASVAVESAAKHIQHFFDRRFTESGKTTLRYSPGYCDWPLQEQQKIFQILQSKRIDVELSDNCLMSPRKTISGVIGICTNSCDHFYRNACRKCKNVNCQYRRVT